MRSPPRGRPSYSVADSPDSTAHDVVLADHRALGLAGGARGVDQHRHVVGAARRAALFQQLRVLAQVHAARVRATAPG